ncbi:DBF4-type zinc finger-containing protein 2 isoform X2 [Antennarius striatus]|uniref:DBF4-type zinc finger-containing protein 2 isoform X2 n=1 Tax=Antennarius striatus TaxID=241820 RepID=UPI0035B0487E
MSDSSDEDDQKKADSTNRMWAEPQPGPSRVKPSRQGYCGYCRVLYSNLDQHLSSLRHLDCVQTSSRGSGSTSSAGSSRTQRPLLERFLQDVLRHHPHRYKDPRPSHADLPSVTTPPSPRQQLDDAHLSNEDASSLGTRDHLSGSDHAPCQPANREDDDKHSQAGGGATRSQAPPLNAEPLPPIHRKAHRKTNRRKTNSSSSSPPPRDGTAPGPRSGPRLGPDPDPQVPSPRAPPQLLPWLTWEKERREAHKEGAFPSDLLKETIEEVIQMCCHGDTPSPCQQEGSESSHFSIPVSMETQSDDWDSPVQGVLRQTAVPGDRTEEAELSRLMDAQVELEDQVYSQQLHDTLQKERRPGGGVAPPTHAHVPGPFNGKSWAQIRLEDEERVERLVRQFRQEAFVCYFDSESLARYGRRSRSKKRCGQDEGAEPDTGILPLLDCNDEDSRTFKRRRRKGRGLRVASRCQVVKVSHSTQTVQLVIPAVHQPAPEATPLDIPAANQDVGERTPDVNTWRFLPPSYSNIITPVQPRTSLVYFLCSPSSPAHTATPGSAFKRCRKKRRPLDLQGLKVKYKQVPVRFYDPSSHRILKNPPKGYLLGRGSAPCPPPPCVRQLFRSLSPDLNTDRTMGEGVSGSSKVKGQRSVDTAFRFPLSALSRDTPTTDKQETARRRGGISQTPPPSIHRRSERESRRRTSRTPPSPPKRRVKAVAPPLQARREGLRRAGTVRKRPSSPDPPSLRRGRARRGRGCERTRR